MTHRNRGWTIKQLEEGDENLQGFGLGTWFAKHDDEEIDTRFFPSGDIADTYIYAFNRGQDYATKKLPSNDKLGAANSLLHQFMEYVREFHCPGDDDDIDELLAETNSHLQNAHLDKVRQGLN